MLNKIIAFSIKNKLIVGLFMLALIAYGIFELNRLPIDAVPDITDNQVQVITRAPSLGAPDVERLITFPVEQAVSNIPGLKEQRSFSRFGLSVVTIVFSDGIDIYWARQQVNERLGQIQEVLPQGFGKPELAPVTTGLGEIYQYVLRSKPGYEAKYTPMELRSIQDWIVRRQLRDVKGVADVSSFGGYLKQYEIAVNIDKLKSYNLTIGDVFKAVQENNANTGGAYIEKGPTVLFIRSEGLVNTIADIESIPVKTLDDGIPVLLRDVATVRLGHATRYGAMSYNGEREVAGAVVMMLKGANSNEVIKRVKERIEQIKQTLPDGVILEPFLDRTKMVNNAIGTVQKNLIEGALIVLFVLVLFLGNARAGILVASVIPLSMLFAVIMMNTFGVSGNLMSLGAIDFGLIVDGTVIIVEAVLHTMHQQNKIKYTGAEMDDIVMETSSRMRNASVFGELIIFIVYIPIFTLQGVEGKMFKPMAMTVAFALLGAFILSLTYVPMMTSLVLSKVVNTKKTFSDRMMQRLGNIYQPALQKVLNHSRMVILSSIGLIVVAGAILSFMGGEFIPKLEEGDFAVETRVLPGSNLTTSVKAVSDGAKILLAKFPEVEKIVGKTGSSEIPTDPMPIDASDMIVVLKDKKDWVSASSFDELTDKMSKELEAIPGVTFGFQYPVQMRFNELMTGARQDVVCKIFGENLDTLTKYANTLGTIVKSVDGAADLYVEAVTGMPQIIITYNRSQMAFYGLNVSEVNRMVNTAFAGESAGQVYEGEKRYDLVVRLAGEQRKNLADVSNLLLPTVKGVQVPLNQVADVEIKESANQIQRENAKRRIIVGFNVRGRDVQNVIQDLQKKVAENIKLPAGYYVSYGGSFENLQAAKQRLSIAVPVSLLLILLMLYFAFGSVRQGLLIYSAIPLSAVGGVFALALRGMPFSISAGVGFIALFGVAVLNGIVLLAEFNRLFHEGETDVRKIVLDGTKTRLRPVLMTAAVASLGFLPMALSQGAGAEVQRPLATVVIGGLITATFLTLFVLPVLYIRFQKTKRTNKASIATLILLLMGLGFPAHAQQTISLQSAIDTAIKNNLRLHRERLQTDYRKAMTGTGWNVPQTTIAAEYGQVNSYYTDNKIGVSQTISFPSVYTYQRSLLRREWESSQLNVAVKENELKKHVALLYAEMLWLSQKQSLLQQSDTLYTEFLRKAQLRFEKGESNILEKTTAETQRAQIAQQLILVGTDIAQAQSEFRYALNTTVDYLPISDNEAIVLAVQRNEQTPDHPYLKYAAQQEQIAYSQLRLERAKLLPDLSAGYFNQSFQGWQRINNVDQYFSSSDRFHYFQAGIGIPLFGGAGRSRIIAARINQQIAGNAYQSAIANYSNQYRLLWQQYDAREEVLAYYKAAGLSNADLIVITANQQFQGGDIDYLQYVTLINQAITVRNEYLNAVREANKIIIELNAFNTNY